MPNRLKLYVFESDINFTTDSIIKFEIDNDDSNYTNGFMTKSTLISLDTIFLAPLYFFENKGAFAKTFLDRLKYIEDYFIQPSAPKVYENPAEEQADNERLKDHKPKYMGVPTDSKPGALSRKAQWPISTQVTWTKNDRSAEIIYFSDGVPKASFGGSGTIHCIIAKKHGLYLIKGMDCGLHGVWQTSRVFDAILHHTDIINSINENK